MMMSLTKRESLALGSIAHGLAGSDPRLASMLGIFSRLTAGMEMPAREKVRQQAQTLGANKPMRVPRLIGRLFAGEAGAMMMTELRGASNAKAKRELAWRPAHPSWRQGFAAA